MPISIFLFLDERNISADHLYTSMTPTKLLLNKNIATGTIQHNRSGIPKNVKSVKNREDFTCSVYWEDNEINLSSCIIKKIMSVECIVTFDDEITHGNEKR